MKQKDLAEEYLDRKIKQEPFKSLTKGFEYAFSVDDIKAAFNAGRESVVENMPELEWKGYAPFIHAPFIHASTPIGRYNIDNFGIWLLRFNGKEIPLSTGSSLEAAKQAANEDYKQRIKKALGL